MLEIRSNSLRIDSTLQELNLYGIAIDSKCKVSQVVKIFEENLRLPGVLVMEHYQILGVVSRRRFFEYMSRPYSLELFLKRPIQTLYEFIQTQVIVFPADTSIVMAARQSLQRSSYGMSSINLSLLDEPIVVQMSPVSYKLLDMHQLLLAQSQIQELTMEVLQDNQQALFQEKEKAQVTLQSVGDAVITTDIFGRIDFLNPVAEKMTGWTVQEAKGLPLTVVYKIINESTREPVKNPVEIVLREGHIVGLANHTILMARDGREFAIDNSAAPICGKNGQVMGAVLVFHDVTQERFMARQLSWQASHDELTGLVNRREFEQQLEQILASTRNRKQQHTLCFMDLDRFKIVNDTCGHIAGDELLRQIASLLQSHTRQTDTLARLGGDEFGLLLRQCTLEQGQRVARALRDRIQEFRFVWQDKTFTIGVSIGLTAVQGESQSLTSVLNAADAACYAAKNKGRNRIQVYQVDDNELAQQHGQAQWVSRITRALEENRFCLYCQAIAPLQSTHAKWEHYEVLLRMIDETGQLVSPMAFIPAAERYNLMPAIDRWVIRTLFANQSDRYYKNRHRRQSISGQPNLLYAINLSGASINDDQFIDFLHEQFILHQISPKLICFEITETVAITNLSKAVQFMREFKALGCHFALDDFGSGMSSFTYLKTLPVDYLKIDGGFIKDIADDYVAAVMVEAIHRIGQVMGIQTIAEFVENDTILEKIKELGVNYAQGYRIAEPRPLIFSLLSGGNEGTNLLMGNG